MVVAAPSLDAVTLSVVGEAALGVNVTSHWNSDFDNPATQGFHGGLGQDPPSSRDLLCQPEYDTALAIGGRR